MGVRIGLACMSLLALAACRPAAGTVATEARQLTYTPEGCRYGVSTPQVEAAGRSGDAIGTATPDHLHATFAGPPSQGIALGWRTDPATTAGEVLYGTDRVAVAAADGPTAQVRRQRGHYLRLSSPMDGATMLHEAHLCGLSADTPWFYKVGAPGRWSAVRAFRTAPESSAQAAVKLAVAGDSRNDPSVFAAVQRAVLESGATAQLFSGDAVYSGGRQPEWDAFFEARSGDVTTSDGLAAVPILMANGNHEALAVNYLAQFALPQEVSSGEGGEGEEWYALEYGPLLLIALNDTTAGAKVVSEAQTQWLERTLAGVDRARTPWVVVFHHRPTYSCGTRHGSDLSLRQLWQPLFDQYAVDLVINGHEHNFQRSQPIRGFANDGTEGRIAADGPDGSTRGTVYIVSGGAGAPLYDTGTTCPWLARQETVNHWMLLEVQGRTLQANVRRLDGTELDRFTLTHP